MSLREAAEQALNHLTNLQPYLGNGLLNKTQLAFVEPNIDEAMKALRQALEQNDLEEAVAKGTKAWADVPDASEWVEQLRGNVDKVDISEERVHKTEKSIHEPVAWMKSSGLVSPYKHGSYQIPLYTAPPEREYVNEVVSMHENGTRTIKQTLIQKRKWVGLTADEIWKCNKAETGSAVEFHICSAHQNVLNFAEAIEAKLKEKNT